VSILDRPGDWSEAEGLLFHQLMHLPEQVWRAAFEPDITGQTPSAAGVLLCGTGEALRVAQWVAALLPVRVPVSVRLPEGDVPENYYRIYLLAPGQNLLIHEFDALVAPKDLTTAAPVAAWYPAELPKPACNGAMFFALARLLERLGVLPDVEALARPVAAMLIQKAGPISSGTPLETNMAKMLAERLEQPVFASLRPELDMVASYAAAQYMRLTGAPAVALAAASVCPGVLAACAGRQIVALDRFPQPSETALPDDAVILFAEGDNDLVRFFSLTYPLALTAMYRRIVINNMKYAE